MPSTLAAAVASADPPNKSSPGRTLAEHAFWRLHPLCDLYAIARGYWRDGAFHHADQWSRAALIDFAESLPETVIRSLSGASE